MKEPDRNLHIVKALLGHSNISTTLEYVEVDMGSLRSVLGASRLSRARVKI
jgi:site-specific recombinase XerD